MDKLKNAFKKLKISTTVAAIALIVIGLMFIIFPDSSATVICYVAGALLLLWGILNLVSFFVTGMRRTGSGELVLGITLVSVALLLFIKPWVVAEFLTVIFGIALIADGALKLQQFTVMCRLNIKSRWAVLVIALISLALGVLLAFDPFGSKNVLMMYAGVSLITAGVLNFIAAGFTSDLSSAEEKNIIDLDDDDIIKEERDK